MATNKTKARVKTKKANAKNSQSATASKQPATKQRSTMKSLKKWNIIVAVLFALQAAAILIIGKAYALPVETHYLAIDSLASQLAGHNVLAPAVRRIFDIDIRYLVMAFLLVSAAIHVLLATIRRNKYESDLKQNVNHLRWIDYAITAGLMLVLIAMLNGVYDVATLITIFALVGILHFLAYFGEAKIEGWRNKLHTFVALTFAGAIVWLTVAVYVKGAVLYGNGLNHWVYWIDAIIFAITLGLAYNTLQVFRAKGKWANYLFGERLFMAMSFVAKTALTWLVFAGFLK